jgi:hypothetical protein
MAEFTADVTSIPEEDAPVAACRMELRSMEDEVLDDEDDDNNESMDELVLMTNLFS